jgi:hypothetical protein
MSHQLEAVIADPTLLHASRVPLCVVALADGLAIAPITPDVVAALGPAGHRLHPDVWALTDALAALAAELSATGTVVFVETDYIGGPGRQAAAVWADGRLTFGPVLTGDESIIGTGAIDQALGWLGVTGDEQRDAFDELGLGRFRRSTDVLELADELP